jgi:hypothetical protein
MAVENTNLESNLIGDWLSSDSDSESDDALSTAVATIAVGIVYPQERAKVSDLLKKRTWSNGDSNQTTKKAKLVALSKPEDSRLSPEEIEKKTRKYRKRIKIS